MDSFNYRCEAQSPLGLLYDRRGGYHLFISLLKKLCVKGCTSFSQAARKYDERAGPLGRKVNFPETAPVPDPVSIEEVSYRESLIKMRYPTSVIAHALFFKLRHRHLSYFLYSPRPGSLTDCSRESGGTRVQVERRPNIWYAPTMNMSSLLLWFLDIFKSFFLRLSEAALMRNLSQGSQSCTQSSTQDYRQIYQPDYEHGHVDVCQEGVPVRIVGNMSSIPANIPATHIISSDYAGGIVNSNSAAPPRKRRATSLAFKVDTRLCILIFIIFEYAEHFEIVSFQVCFLRRLHQRHGERRRRIR
jgi:hypothetical protein